jgi:tetratricopeptide (TPR) repeat protein
LSFSERKIFYLICCSVLFFGCSTKKNTAVSRAYQNFTSHYNIYFNARENLKSGIQRIDNTLQDDFTHILPVYKISDPAAGKVASSEMELVVLKCSKLISLHSITKSPARKSNKSERYKKFASKGEYNKWVDDSYLLMGKANYFNHDFHRAEENFNFVIRKFPDNSIRYQAYLWLGRTFLESGEYEKAQEIFNLMERDGGFPKKNRKDLQIAQADYYIKTNDYPQAISRIKLALQSHFQRDSKRRYHYILAQLLTAVGKPTEAAEEYHEVLKLKPSYQMAFNARISALELDGAKNRRSESEIGKLLSDKNNLEFLDRIYYAKGQIALRNNLKSEALNDFRLSVKNSVSNNHQRAVSSLSAARILFEENDYLTSACYYDSAMAVIDLNYPGYREIKTRSESLRRLAGNLNTISREDSLQKLAKMPVAQRNQFIDNLISKLREKEQQKAAADNTESADQNYFRAQQYRPQIRVNDSENLWYFYNPTTVGIGKTEFQRIWGKRKLEDNWRRKNKVSVNSDEMEQLAQEVNQTHAAQVKNKIADPKSRDYYLQDIPLSDSLKLISGEKIKSSCYNAGKIYQVDFNDFPRAISMMEELNRRFPGSIYELPSWFELYQLNEQTGNKQLSTFYKEKITSKYPTSNYALYLLNPDYFANYKKQKEEAEKKYAQALEYYRNNDFSNAAMSAGETISLNPDSSILTKAKFIKVVSEGSAGDRTVFASNLDNYIKSYPNASTTELARQIRTLIKTNALADYQQLVSKGYISEKIINNELNIESANPNDEFHGKYSYDQNMFHYFVIAFPSEALVDVNRLIYDIANFNLDYYTSSDFDIEKVNLNPKTQLLVIREFPDKEEGLIYFRSIIRKRQVYKEMKNIEYVNFIASSTNYRKILEEKDYLDYLNFFTKNYSPYYTSVIPSDELPLPAELLKASKEKEEETAEKGKYIMVESPKNLPPPALPGYKGPFNTNLNGENLYAFIFQPAETDTTLLKNHFKNLNSLDSSTSKLTISIDKLDDYRSILLIKGFDDFASALYYYKKLELEKDFPASLKKISFRHFTITSENLSILKKDKNLVDYLSFFSQIPK